MLTLEIGERRVCGLASQAVKGITSGQRCSTTPTFLSAKPTPRATISVPLPISEHAHLRAQCRQSCPHLKTQTLAHRNRCRLPRQKQSRRFRALPQNRLRPRVCAAAFLKPSPFLGSIPSPLAAQPARERWRIHKPTSSADVTPWRLLISREMPIKPMQAPLFEKTADFTVSSRHCPPSGWSTRIW